MNAIASSTWAYPVLEAIHIAGVALLVGSLVVFELKTWGFGRAVDALGLARLALPVTVTGFVLAAGTGAVMFSTAVDDMLNNPVFITKMGLVAVGGLNAIAFHVRNGLVASDRVARAQTALSLLLWFAVIACGRFIAYK